MKYSEEDYTLAGIITAYPLSDIDFKVPFVLPRRYLGSADDFTITPSGKEINLPIVRTSGATVKESEERDTSGSHYVVTVQFDISHISEADYANLSRLRTPHHLLLTHLGDRLSIIRAAEVGWQFKEESGKVTIEIHNPNGQQRVI